MLQHFKSKESSPVWLFLTTPTEQTGWRKSKPISGQIQAPLWLGPQRLTSTNSCGQPSSPKNPEPAFPTVVSGTLQPGLHHHTLLHPLPAGKSPAAGWPLLTGLVLLHEMNRCGVGVGEPGCRECSRGSSCPGVPGDSRELLSSQPAWLTTAAPRGLLDLALSPRRAAAAPQTPAAMSTCTFTLCHPLGFVTTPPRRPSVPWVCGWGGFALAEDGRSLKSHWHLYPNLSNTAQTCSPVGSGEAKPDLTRGNKYIKVRENRRSFGEGKMHWDESLLSPKQVKKKHKTLF